VCAPDKISGHPCAKQRNEMSAGGESVTGSRGRLPNQIGAFWRLCKSGGTRRGDITTSCCTCASAMLAKRDFCDAGTSCAGRKSKSRLNSKGLDC
jgi:hypothetical protein